MVLKEILDAFRNEGAIPELLRKFDDMIERCEFMFKLTDPSQITSADMDKVYNEIYKLDKGVNEGEKNIRYKILGHLSVNPGSDVTTCMVLMVVSKDAERIGDYCKNIFEVLLYCGPSRYASVHVGELQNMREKVSVLIPTTRNAFKTGNIIEAQKTIEIATPIMKQADFIVQQILEETNPQTKEQAAQVLLARHYKRVSGHLSNICTAITAPVDMLGYHDEPQEHKSHTEQK